MDYFYFFFHRALELARTGGTVNYITTNYYWTATYADKLRQHIKNAAVFAIIVSFEQLKLFKSAQGQHNAITMLVKDRSLDVDTKVVVTRRQGYAESKVLHSILYGRDAETSYSQVTREKIVDGAQNYIRIGAGSDQADDVLHAVLSKIESAGVPLVSIANIVQGIVTGANQATDRNIADYGLNVSVGDGIFVLTRQEIEELQLNSYEMGFVKPCSKILTFIGGALQSERTKALYTSGRMHSPGSVICPT
jgi:adenine-specific DNA-methyltransferase